MSAGCKHGAYHTVNENGYHALTCAILEQACADAKAFAGYGILSHGKINSELWPTGHGRRFSPIVQGYRHPGELQELIYFFRSGFASRLLLAAGIEIDHEAMLERVGVA